MLIRLGVRKGDRVGVMLSRCIECYVSFLGIWKVGAVGVPLFTAFGPEAAGYRIKDSGSKVLITDAENRGKLERIEGGLSGVQVVVVCRDKGLGIRKGDVSFYQEIADASPEFDIVETTFDDPAVAQYTSGTTGPPKGTIIPHGGVISEVHYAKCVMDVREDDMFWGFMDPGWAHGLLAAGTTLLILGRSLLVYSGRLDPNIWYDSQQISSQSEAVLQRWRVPEPRVCPMD